MALYKCELCDTWFERVGNAIYCPGPHTRPCPICGKDVPYHRPSEPIKCCSRKCSNIKLMQTKRNNLEMRKCELCGTWYQPDDVSQKYCKGPHETNCVICGKKIIYTCHPSDKPKTCSVECSNALRAQTCIERNGCTNASEIPEVRAKISAANSKGGVGDLKRKHTLNIAYGDNVNSTFQIPSVVEHYKELLTDPEYKSHRFDNYRERTGYDHPAKNPETHRKRLETRAAHGPYENFIKSVIAHHMTDSSKIDKFLEFRDDPIEYIKSNFSYTPSVSELCECLGVTSTPIYEILADADAREYTERRRSSVEYSIQKFVESLGVNVVPNNRKVIPPNEIDIWIPDYSIGIEYNPTYTHNSTKAMYSGHVKPRTYHKQKSDRVAESGAFLFNIFGYDWEHKRPIIKSMIKNLLHKTENSIGARKLTIKTVPYRDACEFLNKNHLQGALSAKIFLGLYTSDGELISIMTFNHLRNTMGKTKIATNDVWELSRFCNKLNTSVPGGASKLLKYFVNTYHPSKIISFSDNAHVKGALYENLGFTKLHTTQPRYVWADRNDKIVYSRVACQKNKLRKLFNDPTIDIEHKTEVEIMSEHGFLQVFDAGVTKWELSVKE